MRLGNGLGIAGAVTAAAIGLAGCAAQELKQKEIPVYNPPREVVQELGGLNVYKEVWSNAETLRVSLYAEFEEGTKLIDSSWERKEARNSGQCLTKKATLRTIGSFEGQEGVLEAVIIDDGCDLGVLSCTESFTVLNGTPEEMSEYLCPAPEQLADAFASTEQGLTDNAYGIEEQTRLWHERKGVK
ncbi:MAG: hypothetical protein KJ955_08285 [Nanoarchaeota archaeon]|nr:hypothetical protein [Nanoarchaeota archaeon]